MLRRLAPLLIAVTLVPTDAAVASASVKDPVTIVDCARSFVRPTSLIVTCADANRYVAGITWTNWGAPSATARGTLRWNDCSPTCVAGHWHHRAVSFRATTIRHRMYTRLHAAPKVWGDSSPWWSLS